MAPASPILFSDRTSWPGLGGLPTLGTGPGTEPEAHSDGGKGRGEAQHTRGLQSRDLEVGNWERLSECDMDQGTKEFTVVVVNFMFISPVDFLS